MILLAALLAVAGEPTLAEQGVAAFKSVCLDSRQAGLDGARAALAAFGAKRQADLPPIANSKPMEMWTAGELEFLLRPNSKRYGCFVAFTSTAQADTDIAVSTLSALPGLVVKPVKPSKRVYYEWTLGDGSKDHIRLTPRSQLDGMLINLEVAER